MDSFGADRVRHEVILAARILLVVLYLVFGWEKLTNYSATVDDMAQTGAPMPPISALVSIAVELFVSIAIVLGVRTRQLALVLTLYTLATALIGHHFWTMTGTEHSANEINFYKNISIMGGFLLLYVTGAGKYSVDARFARPADAKPSLVDEI